MSRRWVMVGAAAGGTLMFGPVSAQERICNFDAPGRTENVGEQVIVLHDAFTVLCDDGAQLRASSGRLNQATRELYLNGDVFFRDADRELTSDEATYNSVSRRLFAYGNVEFSNEAEGSLLRGPELEYFRENEERPLAQVLATRRPTLTLTPRDSTSDGEPMTLVADRVLILGGNDLSAFGTVVITRTDMEATGGEARYNSDTEDLELRQSAQIRSAEYDLTGEVIQVRMNEGSLEHVHARTNAELAGVDARVQAPDLQLFFSADTLRQAVAMLPRGTEGERARAFSAEFDLVADSILSNFVSQRIDEVHAVGTASATSVPPDSADSAVVSSDSITQPADSSATPPRSDPGILANDWIRGDTIFAYFEPVATVVDSTAAIDSSAADGEGEEPEMEIRTIVAIGHAQSLYRMAADEEGVGETRPNVNFLVGERIELDLFGGELQVANVTGLRRGVYLEATNAPAVAPAQPGDPRSPVPDLAFPPDAN